VSIARARLEDIPALVDLMAAFHAESDYTLDRAWAEASFRKLLDEDAFGTAWIARENEEAVGYVVLTLRFSMEFGALAGMIDDLFVQPAFRRRGIGSGLLEALVSTCRAIHVAAIQVEVDPGNAAGMALYRRLGLHPYTIERQTLTMELA
jgi:ribosomal protein S18 acetylase RimI-like enzyme